MKLSSLIKKELFSGSRFIKLLILNLTFGLSGLITVETLRGSIHDYVAKRSKSILGSDLAIQARRPLNKEEIKLVYQTIPKDFIEGKTIEVYSMVKSRNDKNRMVQLKAKSDNYPYYGAFKLRNAENPKLFLDQQSLYVYPEILIQLGVKQGDDVKVGEQWLKISDIIEDDPSTAISTQMAPRAYISIDQLKESGLLQSRSIAWYKYYFSFPKLDNKQIKDIKNSLYSKLIDPDIQVYTHEETGQQTSRLTGYFNDFLGLVSLTALFLSLLGAGFLFRSFLSTRTSEIALYYTLGIPFKKIVLTYLSISSFFGLLSSILTIGLGLALFPLISFLLKDFLPIDLGIKLLPPTVFRILTIGTLSGLTLSIPFFSILKNISPSLLLKDKQNIVFNWNFKSLALLTPLILFFYGLSVWQSQSLKLGSIFFALFSLSLAFLYFGFGPLLNSLKLLQSTKVLPLRWAILLLTRQKSSTATILTSLSLGIMLINLIPQLRSNIETELKSPTKSKIPSFFLFDIQSHQAPELEEYLKNESISLHSLAPMIRSRLITVNNQKFEKQDKNSKSLTREQEQNKRFRNRGFNLSYRGHLIEGEKVIQGQFSTSIWDENSSKLPELSIEQRFAKRMNFKMGDILKFDIQGIEIEGKITSIRQVKWTTFRPNFFILFQKGVLTWTPKTYLASINNLPKNIRDSLQLNITNKFPNISIIDVTRLVSKLGHYIDQLSMAMNFMAAICIVCGFFVMFSIFNYQSQNYFWTIGLLKSLGASKNNLNLTFYYQGFILALLASFFGPLLSLLLNMTLSLVVFERSPQFDLETPFVVALGTLIFTSLILNLSLRRAKSAQPKELLSSI